MFDIKQFRQCILSPTMEALQIRSPQLAELMVFTCATESAGGTYLKQIVGPALGIYQIEPATFTDVWINYILRKPDIVNLLSLNLGVHRMPMPTDVIHDLRLATATSLFLYIQRKAKPLDSSEETMWDLYKRLYNTVKGKATKDASIKAYRKFAKV